MILASRAGAGSTGFQVQLLEANQYALSLPFTDPHSDAMHPYSWRDCCSGGGYNHGLARGSNNNDEASRNRGAYNNESSCGGGYDDGLVCGGGSYNDGLARSGGYPDGGAHGRGTYNNGAYHGGHGYHNVTDCGGGRTAMGHFTMAVDKATTIEKLTAEALTVMGHLVVAVDEATMMGHLAWRQEADGASRGGGGRGYDSRAAAHGGRYNDCAAYVGDHSNGAPRGGWVGSGVAARGSGSSTCFAVRAYEGPSHREHLRSLFKTQQYHHKNSVPDSMGYLSENDGHDDMTDLDDALF